MGKMFGFRRKAYILTNMIDPDTGFITDTGEYETILCRIQETTSKIIDSNKNEIQCSYVVFSEDARLAVGGHIKFSTTDTKIYEILAVERKMDLDSRNLFFKGFV